MPKVSESRGNVSKLLEQQELLIAEMKSELNAYNSRDFVQENRVLEEKNSEYEQTIRELQTQNADLANKLLETRAALTRQLFNEKLGMLEKVNREIDVFYYDNITKTNRLKEYEYQIKTRISWLRRKLSDDDYNFSQEMNAEIDKLEAVINQKIKEQELIREQTVRDYESFRGQGGESLKSQGVTQEEMEKLQKRKSMESFIGLNVFSKIGILFLVIGTLAVGRYAYTQLNEIFKAIFMFVFGGAMAGLGEFFSHKKKSALSVGFAGGGIAILYIAAILSNTTLNVYNGTVSFVVCALITLLALFLSNRHKSQTICIFSSVGGYLPLLTLLFDVPAQNIAAGVDFMPQRTLFVRMLVGVGYLLILSVLTLFTCYNKRWYPAQYIGFAFNTAGLAGLLYYKSEAFAPAFSENSLYQACSIIIIIVAVALFAIYSSLPLYKAYKNSEKLFKGPDLALLISNAVVFYTIVLGNLSGLTSAWTLVTMILLLAVFVAMLLFNKKVVPADVKINGFFTVATIFTAFLTPTLLDKFECIAIVWIVEAALLFYYSVLKNDKMCKIGAYIIYIFSLFKTLNFTGLSSIGFATEMLFLAVTIFNFVLIAKTVSKQGLVERIFKSFSVVYFATMLAGYMPGIITFEITPFAETLLTLVRTVLITAMMYFIACSKIMRDKLTLIVSAVVNTVILINVSSYFNHFDFARNYEFIDAIAGHNVLKAIILIFSLLLSIAMMFVARTMIINIYKLRNSRLAEDDISALRFKNKFSIVMIVSSLILFTGIIIANYPIDFDNPLVSIIYIVIAAATIIYGFAKKLPATRTFGLVFTIFSLAKLFLFDLSGASEGWRIVSYFAFGVIIISISAVYQHYNKKLKIKQE